MQYPLYEYLLSQVRQKEEKNIDMNNVCLTINNLTLIDSAEALEHYEEIHSLILHHDAIENGGILLSSIPNDGKLLPGGKGILYTLNKLPNTLRQIIVEYIEYYSK